MGINRKSPGRNGGVGRLKKLVPTDSSCVSSKNMLDWYWAYGSRSSTGLTWHNSIEVKGKSIDLC